MDMSFFFWVCWLEMNAEFNVSILARLGHFLGIAFFVMIDMGIYIGRISP
jgi:hypothetical protein